MEIISNSYLSLSPRELARINGLPEDFLLTDTKSTNGEIIGQGVCYEAFNAVGKMIINHFNSVEIDLEAEKLNSFKLSLDQSNNVDYSDEQLNCFMNGSLF